MAHFTELASRDAEKFVVEKGLSVDDIPETIKGMNDYFREIRLFQNGCKIVSMEKIEGNVNGDKGRADWLLELSTSVDDVSPVIRVMQWPSMKWLDDFIENYKDDYIQEVTES